MSHSSPPVSLTTAKSAENAQKSTRTTLIRFVPALLGTILYLANNLGVIHSFIAPHPGYVALGVQRYEDIALYLTWLRGFERAWFIPNFHAAWSTPRNFIVLPLIPVARLARLLSLTPACAFQLFSFAAYLFTAYALAFAYKTFCQTRRQAVLALATAFACVPVLPFAFAILRNHLHLSEIDRTDFFVLSDGFVRGVITVPLLTFGTGFQVLSMALLGRYSNSPERRWFHWLALVLLLSALMHPFEVFVTLGATSIVLLRQFGLTARNLARITLLFGAAGIGMSPYILQSLLIPWVHEIDRANRAMTMTPAHLVTAIGLPVIVVILLFTLGFPEDHSNKTLVLTAWFFSTLLAFFTPFLPFAFHLLDGLFFAVGLLLVVQVRDVLARWPAVNKPPVRFLALAVLLVSLIPHVVFRLQMWNAPIDLEGNGIQHPIAAVSSDSEFAAVQWLRLHANEDDLVLAPKGSAAWLTTAAVHSFGSHWLLSLVNIHRNYWVLQDSFYAGKLTPSQAHQLLETLGVRFVVVPDGSRAIEYFENAVERTHLDAWSMYEIPGAHMKPYQNPGILALGEPPPQKH